MKKIAIIRMPEAVQIPEALAVLPETALVAFHLEDNLLYVRDDYAEATISYLAQAGIMAEVVTPRSRVV
jgi:hypothetical protein